MSNLTKYNKIKYLQLYCLVFNGYYCYYYINTLLTTFQQIHANGALLHYEDNNKAYDKV